jgi:hypothetical protein
MSDPFPAAAAAWQAAMNAESAEEALEHVAGLEQLFADAGINDLDVLRRIAVTMARTAYSPDREHATAWRAALSTVAIPAAAVRPARMKTAETLSHYGIVPSDAFEAASGMRPLLDPQGTVVIGVRTAGSYLAPAIAAALGVEMYITVRPTRDGVIEEAGLVEALRHCRHVVIVDEGPGTGFTFRAVVRKARRLATNARILVLHTRIAGATDLGAPDHSVVLEPRAFRRTVERLLRQLPCEPLVTPMPSSPLSLRGYESPKAILGGKYVAKFIGWGSLGRRRIAAWRAMHPYVPPAVAFHDGVVVYELIHGSMKEAVGLPVSIAGYVHRLAETTGMERVPAREILDIEMAWLSGIADADWSIGSAAESRDELGRLRVSGWSYVVDADWKLESAKWLVAHGRTLKLDPFHCHDYADYPGADVAVEIAGAAIELGLDEAGRRQLLDEAERLFGMEVSPALLRSGELAYLHWKIAAYSHCLRFLRHHCVSPEAMERQLERMRAVQGRQHQQNAAAHGMTAGAR